MIQMTRDFGWQCLVARRLAERGVRYIQCTHSYKWDQHSELYNGHTKNAREVDKPIAGLLKDLKAQRTAARYAGHLVWRIRSNSGCRKAATGAIITLTATLSGWPAAESNRASFTERPTRSAITRWKIACTLHDFHATVLHLLGLDHEKLTYRYSGRDFRLTDVAGVVAKR
ncbi:MAG: DUF1501 domain-containing protein [Pyrinomonadaceae bacterium]